MTAASKIETRHGTGPTAGENMFSGVQLLVQPGPPGFLGTTTIGLLGPMVDGPGTRGAVGWRGPHHGLTGSGSWGMVY